MNKTIPAGIVIALGVCMALSGCDRETVEERNEAEFNRMPPNDKELNNFKDMDVSFNDSLQTNKTSNESVNNAAKPQNKK